MLNAIGALSSPSRRERVTRACSKFDYSGSAISVSMREESQTTTRLANFSSLPTTR